VPWILDSIIKDIYNILNKTVTTIDDARIMSYYEIDFRRYAVLQRRRKRRAVV
jgi:hypothetical protein